MLESFKINCYPLNRAIRITISLPKNYNNSTRFYPVIYFLDGQNVFSAKDSFTNESLDLLNIINDISPEKEAIYIGIWGAMNEEKRKFEYQGNILSDFIEKEIHPYLMNRYRMNKYIYSFGCGIASLTALTLGFSNLFKGAVLLSPVGDFSNIILPTGATLSEATQSAAQDGATISPIAKSETTNLFIKKLLLKSKQNFYKNRHL